MDLNKDAGYTKDEFGCNLSSCECVEPTSTTSTPKPTTSTPKPTTSTPKPTTSTPKPTTSTPVVTCVQGVIPDYGPVDDKYHCKIQHSCSDGKISKFYESYLLAEIYCNRIYYKTCDIIVHLGNDKYEIGSLKNSCKGSKPTTTTPLPTTTTTSNASNCNAGYVSGNMANHVRIGSIHPVQCANTWNNRNPNSVLMTKSFTTLTLASIYCERKYKGVCDTIIEYKKGKSTEDWIYEIGSTKTAACPTGDLGDICIKVHKVL